MGRLQQAWKALRGDTPPPEVERATQPPPHFAEPPQRRGVSTSTAHRISPERLLTEFRGWQAIASNAIADEIMALKPVVVVQRSGSSGVMQEDQLDDHPLKRLLDQPNPSFSRMQIFRLLALWITQVGEAYLLKITDDLGVVRQLEPLSPANMELLTGRAGIVGYVHHSPGSGFETEYAAEEVIRIFKPDPAAHFEALGNLTPQSIGYDASLFIDQTLRKHFRDDATPKVALRAMAEATLPSGADKKRWEQEWINAYNRRKGSRAGVPTILPPNFDIHEFKSWEGKELLPIMEHFRDRILSANGVPGSIVGLVQDVNRAAAETNMFVFESTTVKPLADLISDSLTVQLARDFDPRLAVRFEDFITVDKNFLLKKREMNLKNKVISVNEARLADGMEPAQWGELPIGTIREVPYDGTRRGDEVDFTETPENEEEPQDNESEAQ